MTHSFVTYLEPVSIQEAMDQTEATERTVIVGNGFGLSLDEYLGSNFFHYESLLSLSGLEGVPEACVRQFFGFETAAKAIQDSIDILERHYKTRNLISCSNTVLDEMKKDRKNLRDGLIQAVNNIHSKTLYELGSEYKKPELCTSACENAYEFLRKFKNVFYLNYDLLAYWVFSIAKFQHVSDGFGYTDDSGYLKLKNEYKDSDTKLYYPHGSLLIFYIKSDLVKVSYKAFKAELYSRLNRQGTDVAKWIKKEMDICEKQQGPGRLQIIVNGLIACGDYPIFVSEGTSREKEAVINQNGYLSSCCNQISNLSGSLFIYGCSLENDSHILRRAMESDVDQLFICVRGINTSAKDNYVKMINEIERKNKSRLSALGVRFVDVQQFNPWSSSI